MKVKLELDLTFNQLLELLETLKESNIPVINESVNLGALHGNPQSEISKLKLFMDVFNALSGHDKKDVAEENLIFELRKTKKFTEKEVIDFMNKCIQNGQIYERRSGWYAKA